MKLSKRHHRILSILGISLICASPAWSAEVELDKRLSSSDEVIGMKKRPSPTQGGRAIKKTRRPSTEHRDASNLEKIYQAADQEASHRKLIDDFVREGAKKNPLPSITDVEQDLLGSDFINNIDKFITDAFKGDPTAMQILGGLYLGFWDIEKAQSFLFRAAQQKNPEAFWLLSSMCRNKHIEDATPGLDRFLLDEADRLGSGDAKIYKKEMEIH